MNTYKDKWYGISTLEVINDDSSNRYCVFTCPEVVDGYWSTVLTHMLHDLFDEDKISNFDMPYLQRAIKWFVRKGYEDAKNVHEEVVEIVRYQLEIHWVDFFPKVSPANESRNGVGFDIANIRNKSILSDASSYVYYLKNATEVKSPSII